MRGDKPVGTDRFVQRADLPKKSKLVPTVPRFHDFPALDPHDYYARDSNTLARRHYT